MTSKAALTSHVGTDLSSSLHSPGAATSARGNLERRYRGTAETGLRGFLGELQGTSRDTYLTAGALTAGVSPSSFSSFSSFFSVSGIWERLLVLPLLGLAYKTMSKASEDPERHPLLGLFLLSQGVRLRDSDLPLRALDTLSEVYRDSYLLDWSTLATRDILARRLSAEEYLPSALRIARTEATASYNYSILLRLAATAFSNDPMPYKRWVSHHDSKTRSTHLEANGQTRSLSDMFLVGGDALMVPGDPNGSPAETFNCRCVIVGVR